MKNKLRLIAAFLPLLLGANVQAQYCTPTAGSNGCQYGDYIASVNMGTISNSTGCSGGAYGNYTAMNTTVDLGSTYTATVAINPDFNQGVGIFIDWNQDNDFTDAGEFFGGAIVPYGSSVGIAIAVPSTATPGTTRMRVMCQYSQVATSANSCSTSSNYGEFEDYSLLIRNVLPYSAGTATNGWANPTITMNNFSTCQSTVSLNADCAVFNGSSWSAGSYIVKVNGTTIGTYSGNQTINLSSYIPVSSVFIDPTETSNWTAVSGTTTIISNSTSTPTVPSVTPTVSYCQGATATPLTATLTGTGTTLKWYTSVSGHNYSATAPTPSTSTAGTTSYYVSEAEAGGCESPRMKIDVVVNSLPSAPSASNQAHCPGDLVSDLVPNPSSTVMWYDSPGSTTPLATNASVSAGNYYVGQTDANGCNSPKTTVAVTMANNTGTENQIACSSYTWSANGMTYTTSGTYTALLQNVSGCDSTATLNLTINEPNSGSETQQACSSYTWSANGMTYTASGTYTALLQNVSGCDSTATLNLTINEPNSGSETQQACSSYTWGANGITYTTSGTYTAVLPNAAGCDSVVTLDLTINALPMAVATDNGDGTITSSAGTAYQWINCDTGNPIAGATQQTYAPTVNGNYSVEVTNASGCSAVSSCILVDNLAVKDQLAVTANVYPNPASGKITVEINVAAAQFTLTDAKGSVVQHGELTNGGSIDLSSFETGIYFLNLQHDNGTVVKRIVKN